MSAQWSSAFDLNFGMAGRKFEISPWMIEDSEKSSNRVSFKMDENLGR